MKILSHIKDCEVLAKIRRGIYKKTGITSSFAVIVLAISFLFIFFMFYEINWTDVGEGNKFNGMIYLVTFITLLFYTYYTFQIAKSSAKGQTSLFVRTQHSNVLKEFLKRWESSLGSVRSIEVVPITKEEDLAKNDYENFENCWEYKDFIGYHLPTGYSALISDWSAFKEKNRELNELSFNLYHDLKKIIQKKVEDISKEFDMNPEKRYFDPFVDHIYRICFRYLNGEENLESKLVLTHNENYYLQVDGMEAFFKGEKKQMGSIKIKIDNFIDKYNLINNYKIYLDQIKNKLDERDNLKNRINQTLAELIQSPLFAGTKCDVLKDFDIVE